MCSSDLGWAVKASVVLVMEIELDDVAEGDRQTEAVRDIVRVAAESIRHQVVAEGVRVADVHAGLRAVRE